MISNPPFFSEHDAETIFHGNNNLLKLYETNMFSALCIIKEQYISNTNIIGDNDKIYKIKTPARNSILKLEHYFKSDKISNEELKEKNEQIHAENLTHLTNILMFIKKHTSNCIARPDIQMKMSRPDIKTISTLEEFISFLFHRYDKDICEYINTLND